MFKFDKILKRKNMNHLQFWKESIKANGIEVTINSDLNEKYEKCNVSVKSGDLSIEATLEVIEVYGENIDEEWQQGFSVNKVDCEVNADECYYYYTDEDYHVMDYNEFCKLLEHIIENHSEVGHKVVVK